MTIANAHDARQVTERSEDPKLEQTLQIIEYWASTGLYSVTLPDQLSEKLKNNLRARGFGVHRDTISW